MKVYQTALILILCALTALPCMAEETAKEIAQKVFDRDDGKDSWAEVQMTLIEDDGSQKVRKLIMASKDFGELAKRYIKFTEPAAIDGTTFLSVEQHEDRDEQFLYLPSLRRVRRIAADQKDRSFVNTDFTYEDMERRQVERDNFKITGNALVLGKDCWLMEKIAKDPEDSQYEKVVVAVAKDSYLVIKSEMYKEGEKVKTMTANELKKVDGIWTIMDITVHDLTNDHKTNNKILSIRYNKGIPEDVFTQKYLEKDN